MKYVIFTIGLIFIWTPLFIKIAEIPEQTFKIQGTVMLLGALILHRLDELKEKEV